MTNATMAIAGGLSVMAMGLGSTAYVAYKGISKIAELCLKGANSERADGNRFSDKTVSYSTKAAGVIGGLFATMAGLMVLGAFAERVVGRINF